MTGGAEKSILRFSGVSVSFEGLPALKNISFEVGEAGSRIILGAAGSGPVAGAAWGYARS